MSMWEAIYLNVTMAGAIVVALTCVGVLGYYSVAWIRGER